MSEAGDSTQDSASTITDGGSENTTPDPGLKRTVTWESSRSNKRTKSKSNKSKGGHTAHWERESSGTSKKPSKPASVRQALDDAGWDIFDPAYNEKMNHVICTKCPPGKCRHTEKSTSTPAGTGSEASASTGPKKKTKEKTSTTTSASTGTHAKSPDHPQSRCGSVPEFMRWIASDGRR